MSYDGVIQVNFPQLTAMGDRCLTSQQEIYACEDELLSCLKMFEATWYQAGNVAGEQFRQVESALRMGIHTLGDCAGDLAAKCYNAAADQQEDEKRRAAMFRDDNVFMNQTGSV